MEPRPLKPKNRAFWLLALFGLLHLSVGTAILIHRRNLEATNVSQHATSTVGPQSKLPSDVSDPSAPTDSLGNANALVLADGGKAPHRAIDPWKGRAERDAMRERIYRAFGEPIPSEAPADAAVKQVMYMPETEAGTIDPTYIRDVVRSDLFPLARECYGELLGRAPDAGGRLSIDFTIVGDPAVGGIVESAELNGDTTITDRTMAECVRQSMLSMTFDPPPHGGKVTVTYPIDFSPADDDGGT